MFLFNDEFKMFKYQFLGFDMISSNETDDSTSLKFLPGFGITITSAVFHAFGI
jgi:hypothetical protein